MDRPVLAFFAIAYALAWGIWILLAGLADNAGMETAEFGEAIENGDFDSVISDVPDWVLYLLTRIQDFSFTIAGLIMIAATTGIAGLRQLGARLTKWRIPIRWYVAGLIPIALYGTAAILASTSEDGTATFDASTLNTILFSLSSGLLVSLFLRGAMGEELGLRGFALPRLQQHTTPTRASLIIGVLWAGWHLPILLDRGPVIAALLGLLIVGLSFIFTWLFNGSGSLIPPLLFHATQNWEEGFEAIYPAITDTNWETPATLLLLPLALIAALLVRRQRAATVLSAVPRRPPAAPSVHADPN
jgi:membrane protease YdiL (CAAX protease family)